MTTALSDIFGEEAFYWDHSREERGNREYFQKFFSLDEVQVLAVCESKHTAKSTNHTASIFKSSSTEVPTDFTAKIKKETRIT